jgi:hypothetical protein
MAAAATGLAIAGCGSAPQPAKLSSNEATGLRQGLTSIEAAISRHNRGAAQLALNGFTRLVAEDAAAGAFSAPDLRALRTSIAQVRQRIALEVSAPTPHVTTRPAGSPTTAATTPSPPAHPAPATSKPKDHPKEPHPKEQGHSKGPH